MQVAAETLVKTQKAVNREGSQQEGNGETRGVNGEQENATRNCLGIGGEHQDGGEDRADARRPAEREREAEQEPAGHTGKRPTGLGLTLGLSTEVTEADIAIEPARHRGARQENQRYGKELYGPE